MRNLLLLTYTFPPDNTAAAVRPGQLYDYLPQLGYQPHVVASSFEGATNKDAHIRRAPRIKEPGRRRFSSNVGKWFMRYLAPYDDRLPWVPYAAAGAADVLQSTKVDAIFSTSPFLASHFVGFWLKAKRGLPWIADFQDPVRDNPTRSRRWFYPYDAIIERVFFRYADRIIANTDTVAEAWSARYPRWASKISVLWNCYDPYDAITIANPPERSYRVLAHVGSLYAGRHPVQLLSALERLHADPSQIRVKLVGPMEPKLLNRYGSLFDRLAQNGALYYGNRLVARAEALRETAESDYLLLLDLNEKNASFQLPSKLLDYVRYGKPILAYTPKNSPVERVLAQSGVAYTAVDPTDPQETSDKKIAEFLRSPVEPRAPSAWFEKTFNAKTQAKTVADLLDDLLEKKTDA